MFFIFKKFLDVLGEGRRVADGGQPFNGTLHLLGLNFIQCSILVVDLVLKGLDLAFEVLVVFLQGLILSSELYKFLQNIADMFFSGRPCILLQFKIILQPFNLNLKIIDDNLILPVDFSLIILFASADSTIQIFYHRGCLSI